MAITIPIWETVPGISYFFEIALAVILMMAVFENTLRLVLPAAIVGLLIGTLPGLTPMAFAYYLPDWLRIVLPPIIMAALINRGWRAGKSFGSASLLTALLVTLFYLQSSGFLNEMLTSLEDWSKNWLSATLATQGYSQEIIYNFTDTLTRFIYWIKLLLPGFLILAFVGQLFVAFLLLEWFYTYRDSYFPGFGPFIYWKIPEKSLYLMAIALVVALTLKGVWKVASYNTIFVMVIFYAICGLALIEYLLKKLRLPMVFKIIFYLGLFLMQLPGLIIPAAAGLIDSHFDFRKIRAHTVG